MKNKWYRSKPVKAAWVVAEHIFVTLIVASVFCVFAYPAFAEEMFLGRGSNRYEDSYVFEESLQSYSTQAINGICLKELMETDGEYDPDKIIDIQEYWDSNTVSGKNTSGLAYHLSDLLEWDMDGAWYENEGDHIIVCEREDGTYQYYKYAEFVSLIEDGKYKLNGYLGEGEDLFSYLDEMGDTGENFLQIQNAKGKTLFINCWKYDGTYFANQYKPVGADSLLDIVNNDERWNGRLQDACDMIYNVVNNFCDNEYYYWESKENIKEGDTNFRFVYINKDTKKVYSNCEEYTKFKNADQYVEEIKNLGGYVVVEPLLNGFESSIPDADATSWRNNIKYSGNSEDDFLFAAGVDTEYPIQDNFYKGKQNYDTYGPMVKGLVIAGIVSVVLWIIGLVWLTIVAGKNPSDEERTLNRFDRWKTEIAAVLTAGLCITFLACGCVLFADNVRVGYDEYMRYNNDGGYTLMIAASVGLVVVGFAFFLIGYLSLVRRIKAKTLWKDSILRSIVKLIGYVFDHIHGIWKTLLVFAFFVGMHWLAVMFAVSYYSELCVILLFVVEALAAVYLVIYAIGKEKIKLGICKIAEGEVDYKISTEKMLPDHKKIAEIVNAIGSGLDAAVEKSMKSERLKTDLITNVSHDIKTPLTSIINYVDLLKKENFQDPKVQRYIEVLEQKAQRLKVLTEDVVEASKVSSGNVTLEYMRINFVEMIQQTSGEFEEKFKKRSLQEILRLPDEEVVIRVDGRRTWRILENIYNNAAKYAMEGSRVYADLKVVDGRAVFELKNISEQPLNISADELTERFIRGDISRSTEGSGLGLSIARSLTEMQGGRFELYLDGDLFKVTVEFRVV